MIFPTEIASWTILKHNFLSCSILKHKFLSFSQYVHDKFIADIHHLRPGYPCREVDHVVNFQMPMGGGSIGASEHGDYGISMENMWF